MTNQRSESNLAEKLTLFFMLAAILISLYSGLESWFEGRIKNCQAEINTRRRQQVENLAARTDPGLFLTRTILPILRQVSNSPEIDLHALRQHHLNTSGLDICLYRFNKRGEMVENAPERAPNLWLMRNMFPALREPDNRKVSLARKSLDKKIEFAFGYGKDLNSIRENPETLIETVSSGQSSILAWTSRPDGGLILTCQNAPTEKKIFVMQSQALKTRNDWVISGYLNNGGSAKNLADQARLYLSNLSTDSGNFGGFNWFFVATRSARTVFGAFAPVRCPFTRALHLTRLLLGTIAAAFFLLLAVAGAQTTLSLKKLLMAMFFTSSLIPLGGIAFTSLDNLDIYTQIHSNKLRAAKEEALSNIIQTFNRHLASCSATLYKLTSRPGAGHADPETIAMAAGITGLFPEARITTRNSGGELIFLNTPDFSSGRETVFKSLGRRLVERYAPERLDEHKYNGNLFSDSMVRKDDMGFGTILNYPDRLQLINTGNSEMYLFYRLLPQTAGETALAQVELGTFASIKRYLHAVRETPLAADSIALTLSAFNPRGFRWSLPPLKTHEQQTLQMAEVAVVTGKPQFRRFSNGLNGFALCVPSTELSGNCLIAFSSAETLDQALASMRIRILVGALIALILLASVASWISRHLISPLERLGDGIQSLATRNFEERIPVPPGKDEISQLFHAFNDMMAESYDMQIAHSVQEGLVPSAFPVVDGYSMHGMLRAASDLGGDCLDCFKLPNGNLLFLVGDLTGHGVGSALMMAFTRAVTFHWSQREQLSPASLVDQIDSMLRENRTERMFMGIICGVLDVNTHQIELVTKGHIYPLKFDNNGSRQWIGQPAYPLGIARQQAARSITIDFKPGDKLLCMTDGFLEAYNRNMRTIGFDGIEIWATEAVSNDARTWIDRLEGRFRIWCDNIQSDDISIFALIRSEGATADEP